MRSQGCQVKAFYQISPPGIFDFENIKAKGRELESPWLTSMALGAQWPAQRHRYRTSGYQISPLKIRFINILSSHPLLFIRDYAIHAKVYLRTQSQNITAIERQKGKPLQTFPLEP
jgi:hypothetical protein